MKTYVNDCPRCGAMRMTFDVIETHYIEERYGWQKFYETFSRCRRRNRTTTFVIHYNVGTDYRYMDEAFPKFNGDITEYFGCAGYINAKDRFNEPPPDHLPVDIEIVFQEGAKCVAVGCWNAAGTMFRMTLDLATRPLLPPEGTIGINRRQRRDLGMRLPWLFDNQRLPEALRDLSSCIHQDGNDGAHQGTLTKADAEDLLEFSVALLTRLFTEPEKLRLAAVRRAARRQEQSP